MSRVDVRLTDKVVIAPATVLATATLFDANRKELIGHPVSWASLTPSVATVDAAGLVTTLGPGTTKLVATSEGKSGTADLTVLPAVAAITLTLPGDVFAVGHARHVAVTLRDGAGRVLIGRPVTWTSSAAEVATINSSGLVTPVSPGSATITATSEAISATVLVRVVVPLAQAMADSVLRPGGTFALRGRDLSSASIMIAGVRAAIIEASDTLLSVTVPESPWQPCLGADLTLPVMVYRSGADTLRLSRPAEARPLNVDLGAGAHSHLSKASAGRCGVRFSHPGRYVAVPYVEERRDGNPAPPGDSVHVTIGLGPLSTPQASSAHRSPPDRRPATPPQHGAWDVSFSSVGGQRATSCPLPSLGGTVSIHTRRDSVGRLTGYGFFTGAVSEPWTLVAEGKTIAILIDSVTLRLARADPRWASSFTALVSFSDTAAVPFLNAFTRGIPDTDGNGKLITYVTGYSHMANQALIGTSARNDCPEGTRGEAILLNWSHPVRTPRFDLNPVVHEMAHVADVGWLDHRGNRWAVEGFAQFASILFHLQRSTDPLTGNLVRAPAHPDGTTANCFWSLADALQSGPQGTAWGYPIGCNFIAYLLHQHRSRFGRTLKETITAWSRESMQTMSDGDRFLGRDAESSHIFADWLLSWYADDYVSGTSPELQQPMWNLRQVWANEYAFFTEYPLPTVRLTSAVSESAFTLGAPDARFIEFTATEGAILNVRVTTSATGGALGMSLLRVQ